MLRFAIDCVSAACLLLMAACSPRLTTPLQSDSTYVSRTDSVYVRDSIYIDRYTTIKEKGDTVFVTSVKTEYRDRWKVKEVRDTVVVKEAIVQTQLVEKKLTWLQQVQIWVGRIAILIILLLAAYGIIKIIINARK